MQTLSIPAIVPVQVCVAVTFAVRGWKELEMTRIGGERREKYKIRSLGLAI
jgi:hypothetical protein